MDKLPEYYITEKTERIVNTPAKAKKYDCYCWLCEEMRKKK